MTSTERLAVIDTGYACFGLVVALDRVLDAPPIARWTIGKRTTDVLAYYQRKGAKVSWVG